MRSLCYYGNPVLKKKCKEVTEINDEVKKIIKDLKEVCLAHNGSGLAANQIGYDLRIFVNDLSEKIDKEGYPYCLDNPEVYINPVITKYSDRQFIRNEGCLSLPGVSAEVSRSHDIVIEFTNEKGERITKKEKKWRAKCLQHELDHLDGKLYIEIISKEDLERMTPQLLALEARTKKGMISSSNFEL
ncbi:MAG: Peptide deformylase [Chlamydiia bacterium]|nr:Peptide deformylase [Chlamydiia bacterium]